jgi:formylglycine-generating enzyme required for sulfatase activity
MAFCSWLTETRKDGHTYHLPDENLWEAAAVGFEGREYPWGEWDEDACNTGEAKIGKTSAIGIFIKGDTPEGVSDMAGNVWEWTASEYDKGTMVLRGGSWYSDRGGARCASRFMYHPDDRSLGIGFRCVRT